MNDLTLSAATAGLVASIITEIFKFIPALRANSVVTAIVTIIVTGVAAFLTNGLVFNLENVIAALVFALVSYRTIVQPIATTAGLSTQE